MTFTDEKAIELLKKVRSYDLEQDIEDYPENERGDRTDMQFLADEVSWLLDRYSDSEGSIFWGEPYAKAKDLLRETKYGKVNFIDPKTFKFVYEDYEIENAKKLVNEVARLKRLSTKLASMGYHGYW